MSGNFDVSDVDDKSLTYTVSFIYGNHMDDIHVSNQGPISNVARDGNTHTMDVTVDFSSHFF